GEGDRVAADGALVSCAALATDESLLTGESAPVRKTAWDGRAPMARPSGEAGPFVYSRTLVTDRQAVLQGLAPRTRTELGRLRKGARPLGAGPHAAPARARPTGPLAGGRGHTPVPARRPPVRARARRLARRPARGPDPGDGHPAERVPGRARHLPRARRPAPVALSRAHAARPGHRDARRHDGPVRRQDRHADGEPDDRPDAPRRRPQLPGRRWRAAGGGPRARRVRDPR